ncbi:MAG: hypothetical protein IJL70_06080 [Treponema sp.]|nr:hypothetical protein [Treponema sp.]
MNTKLHWTWKKVLGLVLGICGIGTLTSCYGMVENDDDYMMYMLLNEEKVEQQEENPQNTQNPDENQNSTAEEQNSNAE